MVDEYLPINLWVWGKEYVGDGADGQAGGERPDRNQKETVTRDITFLGPQ